MVHVTPTCTEMRKVAQWNTTCYLRVGDQQLSRYSCCHLARTFLAFLSKGPDTPARKDAINRIQSQQKSTAWKLRLGSGREGKRERAGVIRFPWRRCALMLPFWPLFTFPVSLPVDVLGLTMGCRRQENNLGIKSYPTAQISGLLEFYCFSYCCIFVQRLTWANSIDSLCL